MPTHHAQPGRPPSGVASDHGTSAPSTRSSSADREPSGARPRGVEPDRALSLALAQSRPVARGATAEVHRIEHPRLRRPVAVKVLSERHRDDATVAARLEREGRAVARVRDLGVPCVYDVVQLSDGRPAVVSEWIDGEDLESHLKRVGRIESLRAIAIGRDVALALGAAHACGVLHRDVKPSNVMLVDEARYGRCAVLLDFGVARSDDEASDTATGGLLGTPAYMAPEQARDASRVDERADVYGTSALMFRMLAGEPPYAPGDPWATLHRLANDPPRSLAALAPDTPLALRLLVERGLSRDPRLRPESALALSAEFSSLLAAKAAPKPGAPPPGRPAPADSEPGSAWRTHGSVALVLATVALFASASTACFASAFADPAPSGTGILLVLAWVLAAALGAAYIELERKRGGGDSATLFRLATVARRSIVAFAVPTAISSVGARLLGAFGWVDELQPSSTIALGLAGMIATVALSGSRRTAR